MSATREILFNAGIPGALAVYLLMTIPLALAAYGIARRVSRWRAGRPEDRFDQPLRRLADALRSGELPGRTDDEVWNALVQIARDDLSISKPGHDTWTGDDWSRLS